MKRLAAFGVFLLFLGGIALVNLRGMSEQRIAVPPSPAEIAAQPWRTAFVAGDDAAQPAAIEVQFDTGGGIVIRGACNEFAGDFVYADGSFRAGPLHGTKKACVTAVMQADTALLEVLAGPLQPRRAGNELRFYNAEGTLLLRLVPAS